MPIRLGITIKNKKGKKENIQINLTSRFKFQESQNEIIFHCNECIKIKDICEITIAHQTGVARIRNIIIQADVCIDNEVEKVTLVNDKSITITSQKPKPLTLVCQ